MNRCANWLTNDGGSRTCAMKSHCVKSDCDWIVWLLPYESSLLMDPYV